MCGIAGFTNPTAGARQILSKMNSALGHRGPDGSGVFLDSRIALGHTRLAIIDVAGGAQPRVDEGSGDALVFNGEIYGYRAIAAELRDRGVALRDRSDTEVLFQLIRREGVRRALERIDGMFAFAFRDGATDTLYLVRDRLGEKPLYYGIIGTDIVFASEVSALQCHPAFADTAVDRVAAYTFLLYEYLPGRVSGWHGISKLEPGTILTLKNESVAIEQYWQPRLQPVGAAHREREAVDRVEELLAISLRDRIVADVPVGIFLSGGLDSSLVTAFALKASSDLTAFSVRIGRHSFDETPHAAAAARHLGISHEIVDLGDADLMAAFDAIADKLSEPLADSSLLPTYLVCQAARSLMTVALGGDGADELFLGYPNFAVQRFASALRLIPSAASGLVERALNMLPGGEGYMNWQFLLRQLTQGFGAPTARQSVLWMAPFAPSRMTDLWDRSALPTKSARECAFAAIDRAAAEACSRGSVERLAQQFLTTYLPEDILTKTDRASMFNSLEVRAPFLSRALVEYSCGLPTWLKLRRGEKKYVLKQLACRYLPKPIVYRKKHGFAVPIGGLIRTLFWTRCEDVLMSSSNPVAAWFRRAAIDALLSEHRAGRADHGKKLWALYILFIVAGRHRNVPEPAGTAAHAAVE